MPLLLLSTAVEAPDRDGDPRPGDNKPKIVVAVRTILLNNCLYYSTNTYKCMQDGAKSDYPDIQYDREIDTSMDRELSDNGINFVRPVVAELEAEKYITKQLFN